MNELGPDSRASVDPVALVAGPDLKPVPYRCPDCHAIDMYPDKLPTGGVPCTACGARIASWDVHAYAAMSERLVASLVDISLTVVPTWMLVSSIAWVMAAYGAKDQEGDLTRNAVIAITAVVGVIAFVCIVGYLWWGNASGQSVGKRLTGSRVVRMGTGSRTGAGRGLLRTLGQLLTIATLGLGYATARFDHRRRAIHDVIARTIVERS